MGATARRSFIVWTLAIVLAPGGMFAQTNDTQRPSKKRWIVSAIMLVASNVADGISSRGAYEANPLMRNSTGSFSGGRALAIKSGFTGGALAVEWLLLRRNPNATALNTAAVANFAAAGAVSAIAIRNASAGQGTRRVEQ
jgi:hypothetical protein